MGRTSAHKNTQIARLEFGDHTLEIGVVIGFVYYPAVPATPPTYDSGGDPPEGPGTEIESIAFKIDGKPVSLPEPLSAWLAENIDHDELCEKAHDDRLAWADEADRLSRQRDRDEPEPRF